ncbi:MAG: tail fiber domain-containing protein [Verrucomicrobiota bacterium]
MKTPPCLLPVLAAALWLPALSLAQTPTTGLPGFISYQGRVLNSAGTVVGAGTPENRTVIFRIWDHSSNAVATNLIYSETQTVTISEGEFSVLVGQGVGTAGETTKGPPNFSIANAFNGSGRYLGVTVDDGTAAADNEITPRQQIVSSAFAFRSKFAEVLGTASTAAGTVTTALTVADSGNIGVGTATPGALFTINGATTSSSSAPQLLITDTADTNKRLRIGVDGAGSAGFIQSNRDGTGTQSLLLNPLGGNVGINKTNPATSLDVNGVIRANGVSNGIPVVGENGGNSQRLVLAPGTATGTPYGFGIDTATMWQAVPADAIHKWYEGTSEKMRLVKGSLLVGATDAAPVARLMVAEATGTPAGHTQGTIVLDHGNDFGASSIVFRSKSNRTSDYGYLQYQDAAILGAGAAGEASVLTLGTSNDGDDHIALMPSGNVGVGTASPNYKLQVNGSLAARTAAASDGFAVLSAGNGSQAGLLEIIKHGTGSPLSRRVGYMGWNTTNLELATENGANFTILGNNVSIGTTDASKGRLNIVGGPNKNGLRGAYINGASAASAVTHGDHAIGIYSEQTIWSGNAVIASSDERIKAITGVSDSGVDLKTLMGVKITDYLYKDTIGRGGIPQKKVIAQQLEKIFPQAVSKLTDSVPDIYKPAILKDGWVQLATDLKKGERVKLIIESRAEVCEVLEVKKDMFRTSFDPKAQAAQGEKEFDGKLFVYGREVNDFRTVDYDAVAMLNVSATQQLKKEMDARVRELTEENALLRAKLAAFEVSEGKRAALMAEMESRDKAREARLAGIEKMLQSPEKTAARPVALKSVR